MGNNLTNKHKTKFEDYLPLRYLAEGRSLMQHKGTQQLVTLVEHTFACEELMNQYVQKHRTSMALQHQFYLGPFDYQILSLANLCSKQYKLVEYFEYQSHTLHQQIESRAISHRPFTNKELMSILCSVVLAMSHISKLELIHYTLNPTDIIIDQEGVCKVLSPALSEHQFDFNPHPNFYYAPETMKIFKMQSASNTLTNKSAVFTLGMTLLSMIHLTSLNHLYNLKNSTLDYEEVCTLVSEVQDQDLQVILQKMLKWHSYERIVFTELEEMLFEMISKNQFERSMPCIENEDYQINKLEESIFKIKYAEESMIEPEPITNQNSNSMTFHCPATMLAADQEDCPQSCQDFPTIIPDFCCPDEQDRNKADISLSQGQFSSSREQANQRNQAGNILQYSQINKRPLMENSHFSNRSEQEHFHRNLDNQDFFLSKENSRFNQMKKTHDEVYPEYVTEHFKQGKYEGYKLGKYRHGFGTFYYTDGGKYCGEWYQNRMQGRGVLYYTNGKLAYEGEWQEDKLQGYGVLYNDKISPLHQQFDYSHFELLNDQWIKYEGYFEKDLKQGQGTLYLANGEYFRGTFEQDQPHGQGQFRNMRGEIIKGFWLMGAMNSSF